MNKSGLGFGPLAIASSTEKTGLQRIPNIPSKKLKMKLREKTGCGKSLRMAAKAAYNNASACFLVCGCFFFCSFLPFDFIHPSINEIAEEAKKQGQIH